MLVFPNSFNYGTYFLVESSLSESFRIRRTQQKYLSYSPVCYLLLSPSIDCASINATLHSDEPGGLKNVRVNKQFIEQIVSTTFELERW